MLAYLPAAHPDELLYSMLARYHRHVGSSHPKQTLDDLFGSRTIRAAVDFQPALRALSERLPPSRGLTPDILAHDFTLYPYLTAFQPDNLRRDVLSAQIDGGAGWVNVRLGLAASIVRGPAALRYCPACRAKMLAIDGELYWRRAHQLPGVLVCPDDGVPLADSRVIPGQANRHEFLAADENNCPAEIPAPVWAGASGPSARLLAIARASAALLTDPPAARDTAAWEGTYRDLLIEHGFGRGSAINQEHLLAAFSDWFAPVHGFLSGLNERGPDWVAAMARKHRKAFHPLQHVLLQLFLEARPAILANRPFGSGPWRCRNPLADHRDQPVITHVDTHREGDKVIGRFGCACGYVFALAAGEDERPRILDLGPAFEAGLRRLVGEGAGLRAAARALHVDPGTIRRHAERLGLPAPWKPLASRPRRPLVRDKMSVRNLWLSAQRDHPYCTRDQLRDLLPAEHSWLYRHDPQWLETNQPRDHHPSDRRQRRDWPVVDHDLAAQVHQDAAAVRAASPPERVTRLRLVGAIN